MKTRMLQVTLFASLVLSTDVASGQREIQARRLSSEQVASHGLLVTVKADKRKQVTSVHTK